MPFQKPEYKVPKEQLQERLACLSKALEFERTLFFVTNTEKLIAYACYDASGNPKVMSIFLDEAEMLNLILSMSIKLELQTCNSLV